jgi:DNA-binding NarL/FixJ family response regulator
MKPHNAKHEHRRSFRLPIGGAASVAWGERNSRRYTIDNLSLGGALMLGTPAPAEGEAVHAVIRLPGARLLDLSGRVIRTTDHHYRPEFAVAFDELRSEAEDLIHDLSIAMLEQRGVATALVVARSQTMRDGLSSLLREIGWTAAAAEAPLQAIALLDQPELDVRWVVVLERQTQTSGIDLLRYVADELPGVRRLLISRPEKYRAASDAVRLGVADAALLQPVQRDRFKQIVGPCKKMGSAALAGQLRGSRLPCRRAEGHRDSPGRRTADSLTQAKPRS